MERCLPSRSLSTTASNGLTLRGTEVRRFLVCLALDRRFVLQEDEGIWTRGSSEELKQTFYEQSVGLLFQLVVYCLQQGYILDDVVGVSLCGWKNDVSTRSLQLSLTLWQRKTKNPTNALKRSKVTLKLPGGKLLQSKHLHRQLIREEHHGIVFHSSYGTDSMIIKFSRQVHENKSFLLKTRLLCVMIRHLLRFYIMDRVEIQSTQN